MASTYLTKTPSSAGNRKTWTYSAWIKLASTATMQLFSAGVDSGNYNSLRITATGLRATNYNTSNAWNIRTNALLKDTNAWYHIVLRVDTTQSTASDRARLYINGELQTSLLENSYPALNQDEYVNNTNLHAIGTTVPVNSNNFDGFMSHIHLCDGYSYGADSFGSTDATTGEWKINTSPSVSYGTNGFFILKDGNSVTDQSGQSNDYTVATGTLTKTEDCPSNVFCTWNRLNKGSYIDMNYGNTNIYGNTSSNNGNTWGTISFPPSGKYYWETKVIAYNSGSSGYPQIGIIRDNSIAQGDMNTGSGGYVSSSKDCYYPAGGTTVYSKNGNVTVSATSLNDVIMCAMDSTAGNMKFWMGVNGTWWNSGDPANGTNAIWTETGDYQSVPFIAGFNGSRGDSNFGNGYFGTTAVSSAGTNASGNGIFEFDCPQGYTALSTKGLNL
jgi:hypothetical protein